MNEQLKNFARQQLKDGLKQLPENWQTMFKRMYSHNSLELPIDEVVDNIEKQRTKYYD